LTIYEWLSAAALVAVMLDPASSTSPPQGSAAKLPSIADMRALPAGSAVLPTMDAEHPSSTWEWPGWEMDSFLRNTLGS
jgi:hypothetical protein